MRITNSNLTSFKSYVPVKFYAYYDKKQSYVPILKNANLKKCQGYLVRNLNHSFNKNLDENFIELYKRYDADYRYSPKVRSLYEYDDSSAVNRDKSIKQIYLVSGNDVEEINKMAKDIGKEKADAIAAYGKANSFEANEAVRIFRLKTNKFIKENCRRLKSENNIPYVLNAYFMPEYNRKKELKGFKLVNAEFAVDKK